MVNTPLMLIDLIAQLDSSPHITTTNTHSAPLTIWLYSC